MAEPLKNLFHPGLIRAMGALLGQIPNFDQQRFEKKCLAGLDDLEMMQRSDQIAEALADTLQGPIPSILSALTGLLHPDTDSPIASAEPDARGLRGWALVPLGTYVATHGLDHPGESLRFLREMTQRFSAEFAVRPFFRDHPELILDHAQRWARDPNFHVRRLASEGSRPRLPWGLRLAQFVNDPAPLIPLLETLRDDPSDYVRRSVANNLNDISKDHPDMVADLAADWMVGAPKDRQKLLKHACRGLIKAGHPGALAVFGYGPPGGVAASLDVSPNQIALGESLTVRATLHASTDLAALIDLRLGFLKADGSHSAKVFKWTETKLAGGNAAQLEKRLPLRAVTTRRHYPGPQKIALQVNGQVLAEAKFTLV